MYDLKETSSACPFMQTVSFAPLLFYVMKRGKLTTGNQKDHFAFVAFPFIYELWKFKNKSNKNF